MDHNIKIITSYQTKKHLYSLTSKKKQVFIKDGIFFFNIDINKYKCQCSSYLCHHILFFLEEKFKCNTYIFKYFHKIQHQLKYISSYEQLIEEINKNIDVCGICTIEMSFDQSLHECLSCKKYCHQICLSRWINNIKNNKNQDSTCIYCHTQPYF